MNFSFTYEEIADLANFYVVEEQKNEKLDFSIEAIDSGFLVNVHKFKVSFLTIKSKIAAKIESFDGETLVLSIHFKNLIYDFVKKIVFLVILNIFKNRLKDEEDGVDISPHIHFSASKVHVEINKIFDIFSIPMHLNELNDQRKKLNINFTVKKLRRKPDPEEPKAIMEHATPGK